MLNREVVPFEMSATETDAQLPYDQAHRAWSCGDVKSVLICDDSDYIVQGAKNVLFTKGGCLRKVGPFFSSPPAPVFPCAWRGFSRVPRL